MISFESKGSFQNTERFLKRVRSDAIVSKLSRYGEEGVQALSQATPRDDGTTAHSWSYEIVKGRNSYSIVWKNSSMAGKTPVVILLQYGHGTGTGGYVQGKDFINPVMKPIFDRILNEAWREVNNA